MKRYGWLVGLIFMSSNAMAQAPASDQDLWENAASAFGTISMPVFSHQQAQNVLGNLRQQILQRDKQRAFEAQQKEQPKEQPKDEPKADGKEKAK